MNNALRFLVFAVAVGALSPGAFAADYDLPTFLAKVEQNNSDIEGARLGLQASEQSVKQALSALFPTVAAQGSYTRNLVAVLELTAVAADPSGGGPYYPLVYQSLDSNMDNEVGVGIGVSQKVFDASALAGLERARLARSMREAALAATRRGVLIGAKKVYAQALLAEQVVAVMESSERMAEDTYQSVSRKYGLGLATEMDVLMAEVDWKTSASKTARAASDAESAMMALRRLAGVPPMEDVRLAALPEELPPLPAEPAIDAVLAARPDYGIELLSSELANVAVRASRASFLPTVAGSFSYGYGGAGDGSSLTTYDGFSSSVGLTVSLPLYTGGYRKSLMESARLEQRKQELSLRDAKESIEEDLRGIMLRLDAAGQAVASARLIVETSERAASLSKSAFANGMATQLSVTKAADQLEQARLGLLNAQLEYRVAYYDWEQAAGLPY